MPKQILALALCRVSSPEQLKNNSLGRQREMVLQAAESLGVTIPDDGWWSGSVSSKKGTNIDRHDLQAILDRCKKDKRIKYIIVDEVDRFMRSMLEIGYFLVEFQKAGAEVVFASQPKLKTDTAVDTLLLMLEAFKAEGSNEERQRKSIAGQAKALKDGRFPFAPKPGYRRGYQPGIQEIHEVRGPILQSILRKIAEGILAPTQGLVELNDSEFMKGHSPYKMDKFRKIATDPFYAGIVEIDRQVRVRNENGLHEPMITKLQHEKLLKIMNSKRKNQKGPRKNGNPQFPLNNITHCKTCKDKKNGRFVGFNHTNGKPNSKTYQRYRCRTCGKTLTRQQLHELVEKQFKSHPITSQGLDALTKALDAVWKQNQGQAEQVILRLRHKINTLNTSIENQTEAIADPANASIQDRLRVSIEKKEQEIVSLEEQISKLGVQEEYDKEQFMAFAFKFVDDMGSKFLEISPENRSRCKQLVFPEGFWVDENKKVYTPEISPLIRLATNKKDAEASNNSHLVHIYRMYLNFLEH